MIEKWNETKLDRKWSTYYQIKDRKSENKDKNALGFNKFKKIFLKITKI